MRPAMIAAGAHAAAVLLGFLALTTALAVTYAADARSPRIRSLARGPLGFVLFAAACLVGAAVVVTR